MDVPADPSPTPRPNPLGPEQGRDRDRAADLGQHHEHALTGQLLDAMGIGYAVFAADWTIQHVNTETERMTGTSGRALVGQNHWEAFPPMTGSDFERHYRRAVATGEVVVFEAFYPAPLDVWAEVRAIPHDGGLQVSVSDVSARHHAQDVSRRAHQRLDGLSALAAALVEADDVSDLLTVIAEQLPGVVGCDSGGLAVADPEDPQRLLSHPMTGPGHPSAGSALQVPADGTRLPLDAPLPECAAAAGDQRVLVPDRTACLAFSPRMAEVVAATGCQAFAHLPLRTPTGVIGVLSAGWRGPQTFAVEQLEVLETFAAQCAQALSRLQARDAERAAHAVAATFSETLQRALLTEPSQPEDLAIAVRYAPATAHAEVGGDWYDAFTTERGTTSVVIGDVTGHDMAAAAVMAQLRNLLRGIGYAVDQPPAAVLGALDRAARSMGVTTVATAVLAQVEQDGAGNETGQGRVLRWSNAGHLPPLLIEPGGAVRYLEAAPDLVLGVDVHTTRHDHEVVLPAGSVVLLYTDGLVERRGAGLTQGLAWLADAVRALVAAGPEGVLGVEELCDALLSQVHGHLDDDVALLALGVCAPGLDDLA